MPDHIPLPAKQYSVIYADPPWAYQQAGATAKARGTAVKHYPTMTTAEICALPVREIVRGGGSLLYVGNVPQYHGGHKGHGGVGLYIQNRGFRVGQKEPQAGRQFHGAGCLHPRKRGGLPAGRHAGL